MKTPNSVLMSQARETLKGKWLEGVKVTFIYGLITVVIQGIPDIGQFASFVIAGPFALGIAHFWLSFARKQDHNLNQIFSGFHDFWRGLKGYFLVALYTLLWSLLLIIPGIIAALSYSQMYYILAEDKNIGVNAAIDKSKAMMEGNKWKLFLLGLRFIGWALLCILTLGIGFLWLVPYIQVTMVKFYDDIKDIKEKSESEVVPEVIPAPQV